MFDAIAERGQLGIAVPIPPLGTEETTTPWGDEPLFAAIPAPSAPAPAIDAVPAEAPPASLFGTVARQTEALAVEPAGPAESRPMFEVVAGEAAAVEAPPAGAAPRAPMFARLVASDLAGRARQRAAWTGVAAAFQAVVIVAVLTGSAHARATRREIVVEVAVVAPRAARRNVPPPPPPPPPLARRAGSGAATATKPKPSGAPRPIPPLAIVQPREIKAEMKAPSPGEAGEDGAEEGGDAEYGVVGGVVGGVPGGVIGGVVGAEAFAADAGPQRSRGTEIEDAPQYMSAGFRKPAEREPGCFRRAVRLPRDLAGYVSGQMTVRFAVGRDGSIGRVDVLGSAPDARVLEAIVQALRSCGWIPGADARGEATAIWVVMPLRFEMG